MVKIIYCIVKIESRECEILKNAFKKEGASHDREGGEELMVTMTVIFSQIVWMCHLNETCERCEGQEGEGRQPSG